MSIVRMKAPRRLENQDNPKLYLPAVKAPTLPFLLTALLTALKLLLLLTLEESTLNFRFRSVSTVATVVTLLRLYRLLRRRLGSLSGGGGLIIPSLGTGAEAGDKSDLGGSECGNRDILDTRGGPAGIAFPNS